MKKMLLLLMSAFFVVSLSDGTYSKFSAHAASAPPTHDAEPGCNGLADADNSINSEKEGIVTATRVATQQNEAQSVPFPDRVLRLVDTFGKMVMVI